MENVDYNDVDVENMDEQSVADTEDSPKRGEDVVNIFRDIPIGLLVVMRYRPQGILPEKIIKQ